MSDRASTWLDRRIGAALTHRAAHPVPPAWHDLLGRRALARPTLAEDAGSLAADDALRAEDARTAVTSPMPVLLAEFTALALPGETASRLASVCVVAAVLACAVSVW